MTDNLPVIPARSTAMVELLERVIRDPTIEVAKLREVLALQHEVSVQQAKLAFNGAMAMVQEEIGTIVRTGKNPTFTSPYAKLEDLDRAARPIYSRHGFSVRYGSGKPPQEAWLRVTLTIAHSDGYSEEHYLDGPIDTQSGSGKSRTPIQAVGSTVTYLRRYLLMMVLNLVAGDDPADDDGEAVRMPPVDRRRYPAPVGDMPKKRTVAEWLDALDLQLQDAQTPDDVKVILAGREVKEARRSLRNGALERLEDMISTTLARVHGEDATPEDTPPAA